MKQAVLENREKGIMIFTTTSHPKILIYDYKKYQKDEFFRKKIKNIIKNEENIIRILQFNYQTLCVFENSNQINDIFDPEINFVINYYHKEECS